MGKIIRIAIAIAVVVFVWKKGIPWLQEQHGGSPATASAGDSCTPYADSAANTWSSGIRGFVNPPYDMALWDSFRSDVQARIGEAESHCSCDAQSCVKAKEAMSGLRGMVNDVDGMIRSNTAPPSNIVSRQEDVDNLVDQAKALARAGK